MEPIDLARVLTGTPALDITDQTTEEEAEAAFPVLFPFNDGIIALGRFSGQSPWERHRGADEFLHVLEGETDFTLMCEDGPVRMRLTAGSVFVVPKGLWHRFEAKERVALLSATPRPTDVSTAIDPRDEG